MTSSNTMRTIDLTPCALCEHACNDHEPAEQFDCPAYCADCIASDWCKDEASCAPAFHDYIRGALVVEA